MGNRLLGQLMIVAGVFVVLGGVCIGPPPIMGILFQGGFILAVGVVLIIAGAWMVLSSKESDKDGN